MPILIPTAGEIQRMNPRERVAREELARSDQGSGGIGVVLCHTCQQPVRFTAIAIEHAEGSPLCVEQRTFKHDIINAPEGVK